MKSAAFRILVFSLLFGVGLGLGSCKKDKPSSNNNGTLLLKFHITGGGQPFALNKAVTNSFGQRYSFDVFAFYASDVTLTGTKSFFADSILLVDRNDSEIKINPSLVDTMFAISVPAGTYTGLQFGIGPDKQQNMQGGVGGYAYEYQSLNTPLSGTFQQYYWGPVPGYLFFVGQGSCDTLVNNNGSLSGNNLQFHCGTDSDYSTKTFTSIIMITAGSTTTFTINLETNDIFNFKLNSSNMETMTSDNTALAKQILQNLNTALKIN